MNTLPAQELKRRGLAAIDEVIAEGDVYIIRNNQPQYVVISEARYQELLEAQDEAYQARIRASLEDLKAGRVQRGVSVDELMAALDREGELTVRVPKRVLEDARRYAAERETTLLRLITEYLRAVVEPEAAPADAPAVRRLSGVLPTTVSEGDYHRDLGEKHGAG